MGPPLRVYGDSKQMTHIEALVTTIPDWAKDLRLNLPNVLKQAELTPQQTWGAALASAIVSRNAQVIEAVSAEAKLNLSETAFAAAQTAAAIMGMNNIYYRFLHLASNQNYRTIPARLRMQGIRSHGVEPADFELWCVAVSAINGCAACVDSHETVVREKGVSEEAILAGVRIASVIHGVAAVLG